MPKQTRPGAPLCLFIAGLMLVAGGCQQLGTPRDPARDRTEQAVTLLVQTRQALTAGEQKVAGAQASLRTLRDAQGDLRPAFTAFREQMIIVRNEADRVRREADLVRSQAFLYTSARHSDVSTIHNDQMREAAVERTARVRVRYDQINILYGQTNEAFTHYLRLCSDLETYLANELNFPALESSRRWFADADRAGETLRNSLRALSEELSLTSNVLSPTPVPVPTSLPATQF